MRISAVTTHLFKHTTRGGFRFRTGFVPFSREVDALALRVETDSGLTGETVSFAAHGGGTGRVLKEVIDTVLAPAVIGEDPLNREYVWQKIWTLDRLATVPVYAQGPLDVALWDLAGKAAGMPIYQMLGGYREKVPAYASTLTLETVEQYYELCGQLKERGFKAIKLHVWGDPARDVEACKAAREAVGDSVELMLDGAVAYNFHEAVWVGQQIEALNFFFFESPLHDYRAWDLERLGRELRIPLAVGEVMAGSVYTSADFIYRGIGDILRGDVSLKGGISPLVKLAHVCEAFGVQLEVHAGSSPTADMANLHVECAIKNCKYHELIVPEETFHFGVVDPSLTIDADGYVHVSKKPGIGLTLDWEQITRSTAR